MMWFYLYCMCLAFSIIKNLAMVVYQPGTLVLSIVKLFT